VVAQADDGRDVDAVEQLARCAADSTGVLPRLTECFGPRTADRGEMLLDGRLLELARHRLDIGLDMNRFDHRQFVEALGVAPGEEAVTGALVRAAGVVVVDRAEEIGEAFRGAGTDVGDQRRHDDRPAEGVRRIERGEAGRPVSARALFSGSESMA
jgi:hypothetical protein